MVGWLAVRDWTGALVNAVTWGVFPGKEIVQPTVVDAQSFGIWKVRCTAQAASPAAGLGSYPIAVLAACDRRTRPSSCG